MATTAGIEPAFIGIDACYTAHQPLLKHRGRSSGFQGAISDAFDFEEMNRQIFYGQYRRITSYFEGTDLASSGLPRIANSSCWRLCATRFLLRSLPRPILIR